jgi:hypothetical protein
MSRERKIAAISSTGTLPIPVDVCDGTTPSLTYRRIFTPDSKGFIFVSVKSELDHDKIGDVLVTLDALSETVPVKNGNTRSWRLDRRAIESIEAAIKNI